MSRAREKTLRAEIASPGLARGVIHRLGGRYASHGRTGKPAEERKALEKAVSVVSEDLAAVSGSADNATAALLARQIAALSDPELIVPAFEAIDGGEPAATAFRDAIDLRIADGKPGGADLIDLRDRVLRRLMGADTAPPEAIPESAIVVAERLTLSGFLEIDWRRARAAVSSVGSTSGHLALLARSRRVPLLIAPDAEFNDLEPGQEAIVDAEVGRLILSPSAATGRDYDGRIAERDRERREIERWLGQPAVTADGTPVLVYLNVDDPAQLAGVDPAHCDGIGLTRSEFLFPDEKDLRNEDRQYRVYRALLTWAGGLPVTVRTVDAGGDKPVVGLAPEGEANRVHDLRGLRLSLARADLFRIQLRALARAAAHGPLKVMLPMVCSPEDFARARALLNEEVAALQQAGVDMSLPVLGMMVETPAAARNIAQFDAAFYAIGTNDLSRFVMAAGRDCTDIATQTDSLSSEILKLVTQVCARGRELRREVSICGEAASRPDCIPALLEAGLRALSVPPGALAPVKKAISLVKLRT